jgi:hypothetical protein
MSAMADCGWKCHKTVFVIFMAYIPIYTHIYIPMVVDENLGKASE